VRLKGPRVISDASRLLRYLGAASKGRLSGVDCLGVRLTTDSLRQSLPGALSAVTPEAVEALNQRPCTAQRDALVRQVSAAVLGDPTAGAGDVHAVLSRPFDAAPQIYVSEDESEDGEVTAALQDIAITTDSR
jgi:hypothetical protein